MTRRIPGASEVARPGGDRGAGADGDGTRGVRRQHWGGELRSGGTGPGKASLLQRLRWATGPRRPAFVVLPGIVAACGGEPRRRSRGRRR